MKFIKLHGYGNDYLVINAGDVGGETSLPEFARRVCDRHFGAGADGVALVGPAADDAADFRVRIFNPDGSEAAMSGNGTRCAASALHYEGVWSREELRL